MSTNILIVRVSAIGDIIHTLPAVFLLKTCLPHAKISWVVQKKAAALLVNQPFLDKVWVLHDRFLTPANWTSTSHIIKDIRKQKWDAIIDFQGLIKTSLFFSFLSGKKYGFAPEDVREYLSTWFTHDHHHPTYTHIVQKNLSLASHVAAGLGASTNSPSIDDLRPHCYLTVPPEKKQTVDQWLNTNNLQNFILFCPNTTWPSKQWPVTNWATCLEQVTTYLAANMPNTGAIIVGAPYGQTAAYLSDHQKEYNLPAWSTPAWDLLTTAHLISKASLVIGPDTGLLHLADFLGVPTLGIFGPTHKEKHGPFLTATNRKTTIQILCPHVYQKTHGQGNTGQCMNNLNPATVTDQVLQCLEKNHQDALH